MSTFRAAMLTAMVALGHSGLAPLLAQDGTEPTPTRPQQDAAGSVEQWIHDLGSDSFRTRLQAESRLRMAGDKALAELREAAEQADDHEVQWRARRLVRQIERGDAGGLVQRKHDDDEAAPKRVWPDPRGQDQDGIHQRFEQFFRDMENQFGLDIPRANFFHDDFFRDLQEQMQGGASRSQGMSMQVGPDGAVRVEVEEQDADGKVEKKVYEAPDMQTFRAQYPDVLQRGGLGGLGLQFWSDDARVQQPFFSLRRGGNPFDARPIPGFQRLDRSPGADMAPMVARGQRLGVTVQQDLSPELRQHLELADGVGLMVQSVVDDSLASGLGLRAGDIVVRIGARSIGSPADVQQALGEVDAGEAFEVAFLRKGVEQTATTTKPADTARSADENEPPKSRVLRRRAADDGAAKVR